MLSPSTNSGVLESLRRTSIWVLNEIGYHLGRKEPPVYLVDNHVLCQLRLFFKVDTPYRMGNRKVD